MKILQDKVSRYLRQGMSFSKEESAIYRIMRAKEALQEAKLLGESKHWNTTANRLYYACFYIASAYLVINNITATTHKGVKMSFNRELIKTRKISSEFGRLYNDLLNLRLDADYRDFKNIGEESVKPLFESVKELIIEIEAIIDSKA